MTTWYFPSWSGDFRLEALGSDEARSVLTVIDPTPVEIRRLATFLEKARSRNWIEQHVGLPPGASGEIRIELDAPLVKTGKALHGGKIRGRLTAVSSTAGVVEAVFEDPDKVCTAIVKATDSKKDPVKAASIDRPTLCCPTSDSGPERRASEVLHDFCTARQWSDWQERGWLRCYGNLSGHRYQIVNRNHPLVQRRRFVVWDEDVRHILHCYDWSVPPAEEVLAAKLILEYREHWIRNNSGAYDCPGPIYHNPFMSNADQGADGIGDSALLTGAGYGVMGAAIAEQAKDDGGL